MRKHLLNLEGMKRTLKVHRQCMLSLEYLKSYEPLLIINDPHSLIVSIKIIRHTSGGYWYLRNLTSA